MCPQTQWVIDLYKDSNSSQFVREFCELIVNRMLVIEELERNKNGEKNGSGARSRNTRQTRRIMTDELEKELKIFKVKGDEYFTPSQPMNGPHKIPEMGHCIVLPQPLYQVNEGAKARDRELRSALPRVV
jgi:hypothetical protein